MHLVGCTASMVWVDAYESLFLQDMSMCIYMMGWGNTCMTSALDVRWAQEETQQYAGNGWRHSANWQRCVRGEGKPDSDGIDDQTNRTLIVWSLTQFVQRAPGSIRGPEAITPPEAPVRAPGQEPLSLLWKSQRTTKTQNYHKGLQNHHKDTQLQQKRSQGDLKQQQRHEKKAVKRHKTTTKIHNYNKEYQTNARSLKMITKRWKIVTKRCITIHKEMLSTHSNIKQPQRDTKPLRVDIKRP